MEVLKIALEEAVKFLALTLFILNIISCSHIQTDKVKNADKKEFKQFADFICSAISKKPAFKYEDQFHLSFRKAIPYKTMITTLSQIHKEYGVCSDAISITLDGKNGEVITNHRNSVQLKFLMNLLKNGNSHTIAGLRYTGKITEPVKINGYEELKKIAKKKAGSFSILFKKMNGKEIFDFNGNKKHALGSVFKLYILASVLEKVESGQLKWKQRFHIKNEFKSLPSGDMQNLKEGTEVTVLELASKMISVSDNTATDHLLSIVTKKSVEALMKTEKLNNYLKDNSPFLSTLDMFKTRGFFDKNNVKNYLSSDREERTQQISKIPYKNPEDLLKRLSTWTSPKYIKEIEWFATPNDICRLYNWMDRKKSKHLRSILGQNTPFIDSKKSKRWSYVGYKGGSEPGVLEMAYLLEDKKGETYCLYIGQNQTHHSVNQENFFALVKGVLRFLEEQ